MKNLLIACFMYMPSIVFSQNEVLIFGPGGPAPAMVEAGQAYFNKTGVKVSVIAGPTDKWKNDALAKGDLIFSGSEIMLDSFTTQFKLSNAKALYLRPSVIFVRKGNPKNIKGIFSLLKPNINVMVVQGAGQVGLWEDIIGRMKKIDNINAFRKNIKISAPNTAAAVSSWKTDSTIDAWIIWNHWEDRARDNVELVNIESDYRMYRPTSIAYTQKGMKNTKAKEFYEFLDSTEAIEIFKKHGWQKQW